MNQFPPLMMQDYKRMQLAGMMPQQQGGLDQGLAPVSNMFANALMKRRMDLMKQPFMQNPSAIPGGVGNMNIGFLGGM